MQWGRIELHPSLLRIEQRRVRFALISAFFAEIKALSGRRALRLPS
ncbi:hypothetical protein [Sporosarcina sp. YIM B06819]|nr:hypothetical protein [Sporosarcina sp. YIM B06819]